MILIEVDNTSAINIKRDMCREADQLPGWPRLLSGDKQKPSLGPPTTPSLQRATCTSLPIRFQPRAAEKSQTKEQPPQWQAWEQLCASFVSLSLSHRDPEPQQ